MQVTPVTWEIIFIIRKENKTTASPSNPKMKVFFAPSSFLASPAEDIYLMPVRINITKAVTPANARMALSKFAKTVGIQSSVATPLTTHPPQLVNMIKEYQRKRKKTSK
jgi:hypothetical protein